MGTYCHVCGEKTVSDKDFTLKKIIGDGFNAITNLDSKFFKSFITLIFKPGKLTKEYLVGRRKPYMKPFQIFLLSTIAFFLLLVDFDVFYVPSVWYFSENYDGKNIMEIVELKMTEKSMSREEIALLYDSSVSAYSKLFIVIFLPLTAVMSFFMKRKRMPEYGKHFILATHNFSFFMLAVIFIFYLFYFLPIDNPRWYAISLGLLIIFIYYTLSLKNVWGEGYLKSSLKASAFIIFMVILIFLYRGSVSLLSLKLL